MVKCRSIFGPPGTGKSTRLLKEMGRALEEGMDPSRVGLVSFTKAAARELAQRSGMKASPNVATIHSYAFRLCQLAREQVVSNSDLRELGRKVSVPIRGATSVDGEAAEVGDGYIALYSRLRAEKRYPGDLEKAFPVAGIGGSLWQFK